MAGSMLTRRVLAVGVSLWVVLAAVSVCSAQLRAFPGADGFGAYSTGGRGGSVYHVTNLNDSGAGSLRDAISQANRTVVFDIGGMINLTSNKLKFSQPRITVAGQTAPGGGICTKGKYVCTDTTLSPGNLTIRYIRVRTGDENGVQDGLSMNGGGPHIVDHCSASWGGDECLSATDAEGYLTVQWCIISEGLNAASHGYGSLLAPQTANQRWTFHHNLWAHHLGRTPRMAGQNSNGNGFLYDFRNNVTYNWGTSGGDWGTRGTLSANEYLDTNWINNYAIAGSNSGSASYANTVMTSTTSSATCRIYHSGNYIDYDKDGTLDGIAVVDGNFKGTREIMGSAFTIDANYAVTTTDANTAYNDVLNKAGATLPVRDAVDTRIVGSVTSRTGGLINSQSDVGGWPSLAAGTTPTDTDQDGMPDSWENWYGTNPNVVDNNGDIDSDSYTNLEAYLQWLVDPNSIQPHDTPVTVSISLSPTSVTENGTTNLVYTFSRTGSTSGALTVNFSVGGTATYNSDYTQSGAASFGVAAGSVTIPAGSATAAVTIDPTPDLLTEGNETVVLTVASGTGYSAGTPSAATGTIVDVPPHPGDCNMSNTVDISDLTTLGTHWNHTGETWATGDFNGDGTVDISDLAIMGSNWGWTATP